MKRLGNILTGLLHIAGLVLMAVLCMTRHAEFENYHILEPFYPLYDALLIIAAVILIAIHYFVFERKYQTKLKTWILFSVEIIIAISFLSLIVVPNSYVCITLEDGLIVMIVQLLIVSARVFSVVGNYRSIAEDQFV